MGGSRGEPRSGNFFFRVSKKGQKPCFFRDFWFFFGRRKTGKFCKIWIFQNFAPARANLTKNSKKIQKITIFSKHFQKITAVAKVHCTAVNFRENSLHFAKSALRETRTFQKRTLRKAHFAKSALCEIAPLQKRTLRKSALCEIAPLQKRTLRNRTGSEVAIAVKLQCVFSKSVFSKSVCFAL